MGRPSNTVARRQDIVLAFLRVMADQGYSGATIRAIANEADMSSGLIHHHFNSKQDILIAAVEYIVGIGKLRFEELLENTRTPRDRINAFIESRLQLGEGSDVDAVRVWVLIGAEAVRQKEVREVYRKAVQQQQEYLVLQLRDNVEGSALSKREAEHKAAIVLAAIEGAYLLGVACEGVVPQGFASESLKSLIV